LKESTVRRSMRSRRALAAPGENMQLDFYHARARQGNVTAACGGAGSRA
jgi:hypothetical protein